LGDKTTLWNKRLMTTPTSNVAPADDAMAKHPDQKARIEPGHHEIRLSFGLFYLVIRWGKERRSMERFREDRMRYPVMTAANMPMLVALWTLIFVAAYVAAAGCLKGLVYLFS